MYKSLIILLLINLNIFAQTQSIYKRLDIVEKNQDSLKFNIQKIKEIDLENINTKITSLKNKTNELKNYEKDILQIKSFIENNEKITNLQNERISDIHSSIDRFSYIAALFGILITGIVIFFTFNLKQIARKEAEDAIEEELKIWMEGKGTKILNQEAQPLLDLIRQDREQYNQTFNKLIKNFSNISSKNRRQLFLECEKIKLKKEKNYDDWYKLALNEFYNNKYNKSYNYLLKAKESATDDYEKIDAIIGIGVTLESLGKIDDSISVCDDTINKYSDSNNDIIISKIIRITIHKAYRYCLQNNYEEAIAIYSNIFTDYNRLENKKILKEVAFALCNKMELFIILNKKLPDNEKEFLEDYSKNNPKCNMRYEILKIINEAQNGQQEDKIIEWQTKYKNKGLSIWYFSLSEKWSDSIENPEIRNRIKKYLNIFKEYLQV